MACQFSQNYSQRQCSQRSCPTSSKTPSKCMNKVFWVVDTGRKYSKFMYRVELKKGRKEAILFSVQKYRSPRQAFTVLFADLYSMCSIKIEEKAIKLKAIIFSTSLVALMVTLRNFGAIYNAAETFSDSGINLSMTQVINDIVTSDFATKYKHGFHIKKLAFEQFLMTYCL